jgi:hypothetical protein
MVYKPRVYTQNWMFNLRLIKKNSKFQQNINYERHSTSAPDFLSRPKTSVNSLNLVYKQLHAVCIGTTFLRSPFRHLEIATSFLLVGKRSVGRVGVQPSLFLHWTKTGVTPMPPNLRCVVDGSSHSATALRSLWFHRHVARCLPRTWTAAAWFVTHVGVGRSQTFCAALHLLCKDSAVYAEVTEAFMNIYHCLLQQELDQVRAHNDSMGEGESWP